MQTNQPTKKKKMKSADVSLQTAKNQRHDKEAKSADVSLQTAKNQRRDKEKNGWLVYVKGSKKQKNKKKRKKQKKCPMFQYLKSIYLHTRFNIIFICFVVLFHMKNN